MKKLLFFGLFIALSWSCSVDNSVGEEFSFQILPIITVVMPETVQFNETYTINYTYLKPSTCHEYNDLYYISEENLITIAVINTVQNGTTISCEPLTDEIEERSFTFHVENNIGNYIFKFWNGEDESGQDSYLVFDVPIE